MGKRETRRVRKARTLYRPVGLKEMTLILESNVTRFPPRRPEQPIFYPMMRLYVPHVSHLSHTPLS